MGAFEIVFGSILLVFAIAIIIIVLLQEGNEQGVGAVTGVADTFFSKNKARTIDSFLQKWTKFIAVGFFLLVIVVNAIMYFT